MAVTMDAALAGRITGSELFSVIVDTGKDFDHIDYSHLKPHLRGTIQREGLIRSLNTPIFPSGKAVDGAAVLGKLDDILIAGPGNEKFFENNEKLSNLLQELETHGEMAKSGVGGTLTAKQLSTKADQAYTQLGKARESIVGLHKELAAANAGVLKDLSGYASHHNTGLRVAAEQVRKGAAGAVTAKTLKDAGLISEETKGLMMKLGGLAETDALTYEKVTEVAGTFKERHAEAWKTAVAEFETQKTNMTQMLEHMDSRAGQVSKISGKAIPAKLTGAVESVAAEVGKDVGKLNKEISKAAQEAGLVGEEAHNAKGFFSKLIGNAKANLNIDKVTKNASTSALEITERGAMGKGMRLAGAGAGAILVGYGLKDLAKSVGLSGPDTDEQGREVPADSSTLVKSVAELGAGAALAYFTLLKGGKAVGALAK